MTTRNVRATFIRPCWKEKPEVSWVPQYYQKLKQTCSRSNSVSSRWASNLLHDNVNQLQQRGCGQCVQSTQFWLHECSCNKPARTWLIVFRIRTFTSKSQITRSTLYFRSSRLEFHSHWNSSAVCILHRTQNHQMEEVWVTTALSALVHISWNQQVKSVQVFFSMAAKRARQLRNINPKH